MSGGLVEVAAAVRAVAQALPVAGLTAAADGLEHTTMLLAQAGEGSSNPDMAEVIARMSRAHLMTLDLLRVCEAVRMRLLDVASRLTSPAAEAGTQSRGAAASGPVPRRPTRASGVVPSTRFGADGGRA